MSKKNYFSVIVLSLFGALLFYLVAVFSFVNENRPDYKNLPAYNAEGNLNCVVEIPAGTNHEFQYSPITNTFPCKQLNGENHVINFLPAPGNYGFIPSTYNVDGEPLHVVVISESVPVGTIIESQVIGIIQMINDGKTSDKIIAIPVDETKQIIKAKSLREIKDPVKSILKTWLLNFDGKNNQFISWKDSNVAKEIINKRTK